MHLNEKNRTLKLAEEDEGPSKSELKRQMTERQKLAEVLAALSSDALKAIYRPRAITPLQLSKPKYCAAKAAGTMTPKW